jgi:hypothetical protein
MVTGYRYRGPGLDSQHYQIFWEVVGLEWGPLSPVSTTEGLLGRKSNGSGLEIREYGRRDPSRWSRGTLCRCSSLADSGHGFFFTCRTLQGHGRLSPMQKVVVFIVTALRALNPFSKPLLRKHCGYKQYAQIVSITFVYYWRHICDILRSDIIIMITGKKARMLK